MLSYWICPVSNYQQPPQNPYGYGPPQPPQYPQAPPPGMPPTGGYPMGYPTQGPPEQALANQGARLGARILDGLIIMVPLIVVGVINAMVASSSKGVGVVTALVFFVVLIAAILFYEPYMNSKYGATFGKRICGLRVARLSDGQNLSFGAAMGRVLIAYVLGFVPFGGLLNVLWCTWDKPYRQCLHDKVVSSVVVKA